MTPIRRLCFVIGFSALLSTLVGSVVPAQSPYYQGTYSPPSEPSSNDQPPVVYRRVPVYRAVPARPAPSWALPNAAALGPWEWNFDFGGGPTAVAGSNGQLGGGSNFQFGGGYNFTPRTGLVLEFMNAWLGVGDDTLRRNGAFDGDANVWSITLNPIWRYRVGGPIGGYLIGGGGYYRRQLRFFSNQQAFDPFFGPVPVIVEDRQNDDTGGLNIGGGFTWNWGWGTKFFVEARYHYIFTSGQATQIVPVTFGFRW